MRVVAIIGRPNVGKSALFNRLMKKQQALVDATPGLTRDRLYGDLSWKGMPIRIVDTGGLQFAKENRISRAIENQVRLAMEEACMALLVADARDGVVPLDRQVAGWARRWGKPILLVVNKVDSSTEMPGIYEFSALGVGDPYPISSLHGLGIGDLLDAIVDRLKSVSSVQYPVSALKTGYSDTGHGTPVIHLAIVGRPNVGKSSLLNRILNEERVLVDETPGTTRDPVETLFTYRDQTFCLIDTAGIRSRRRLKSRIEAVAQIKAQQTIERADICLGVLEGPAGLLLDDLKLLDQVLQAGKPLCLLVNKWDLAPVGSDPGGFAEGIARRAPFLRFAPVICTSAKTGLNVIKALEIAADLARKATRRVAGADTRKLLETVRADRRTPVGLRNAHLIRLAQVGTVPPTFHLLVRKQGGFRSSELTYLEKVIRREFHLEEIPVRLRLLVFEDKGRSRRK